MSKMIAKTIDGKEFVYSQEDAYEVSDAGAKEICAALNRMKWDLKDGQKWHIYDLGWYEREYTNAGYQKLTRYRGTIRVKRGVNCL